ncbi:MAG TPA: putative zinc-binding metallopeptidase, partial [Solirubrobacteraceae bacterium]|nr:putative zinc-binding metallopeptidase [Solirubrobacteraceae bacterium]
MRAFTCGHCGQLVFFENSLCLRCRSALGFVPSALALVDLPPPSPGAPPELRPCANAGLAQCNWMLEPGDPGSLCRSCRLTRTRPGDGDRDGMAAFAAAEAAKRRLVFQLLDLGLPAEAAGLTFDLLSSRSGPVVTGHNEGLITIDLAESDDARREQRRADLGEPYRTMLGHFRHETGHFCWPMLVSGSGAGELARWRALFGDEREDYGAALGRHYDAGPPDDWPRR